MKRTPLRRGTGLTRAPLKRRGVRLVPSKPLDRGGKLPAVNRKRKAKAFARNFGEKAVWTRELPSVVDGDQHSIEAVHVRSRGAGGTSADLVPMTTVQHRELHSWGIKTFEAHYGLDLTRIAAELEEIWAQRAR